MGITNLFLSFYHKSSLSINLTRHKQNKNKFALLAMTRKETKIFGKIMKLAAWGLQNFSHKNFSVARSLGFE